MPGAEANRGAGASGERTCYAPAMTVRTIAVFCASAMGAGEVYREAAEELGRTLAERGIGLIDGGSDVGLMRALADACLANGGHVVGVIPEVLVDKEVAHRGITELHVVDTMHTRKALMGERADAFLILPGGFGTMEEMFEVLAWQTLGLHTKRIVLLNTAGFYDALLRWLDHAVEQGMLRGRSRQILLTATSVTEAMDLLLT